MVRHLVMLSLSCGLCQILRSGDQKPQSKHLQTRTEYLLKVVKSVLETVKKDVGKKVPKLKIKLDRKAAPARKPTRKRTKKRESVSSQEPLEDLDDEMQAKQADSMPETKVTGRKRQRAAAAYTYSKPNDTLPKLKESQIASEHTVEPPAKKEKRETVALPAKKRHKVFFVVLHQGVFEYFVCLGMYC